MHLNKHDWSLICDTVDNEMKVEPDTLWNDPKMRVY